MRKMMDAHAEKLLAEFDHRDEFTSRVRTIIVKGLAIGEATLDEVARHLAITPRTLQRRMNERDETFKSVLDEVRRGLALTYIAQPSIDLAELAYLLGFSDQTAFQRAFKKWTGTSPGKYKKSLT
jgi:AraC-like DNA-binding protein